jgi:hypothetical protein
LIHFLTPTYRRDPRLAGQWIHAAAKELGMPDALGNVACELSHVASAREALVGWALAASPRARWALLRDDDVALDVDTIRTMLAHGGPAVLAPYEVRPDVSDVVRLSDGSVAWGGLGAALVRMDVLDHLTHLHDAELGYEVLEGGKWVHRVALFESMFVEIGGRRQKLRDDHAFWLRVRMAGYPVVALDRPLLPHRRPHPHAETPADLLATSPTPSRTP